MKDGENETPNATPETIALAVETPAANIETVAHVAETIATPEAMPEAMPETPVATVPAAVIIPEGFIARTEFDAAVARAEAAEARAVEQATTARNNALTQAANELGFHDAEDARRLVAADATDIKAALTEILKTKSYLARGETPVVTPITAPTNPPRTDTLSLEAMRGMTPAQLASNWQAVKEALKLSR